MENPGVELESLVGGVDFQPMPIFSSRVGSQLPLAAAHCPIQEWY